MGQSEKLVETDVVLKRRYTVTDGDPLVEDAGNGRTRKRTIIPRTVTVRVTPGPNPDQLWVRASVSGPILLKDLTMGRRSGHLFYNMATAPKWLLTKMEETYAWATTVLATEGTHHYG